MAAVATIPSEGQQQQVPQAQPANTAVEVRKPAGFEPVNLTEAWRLADQLGKSGLIPKALQGKPEDVFVVLLSAHELGLSPMQGLRGMAVVNGKVVTEAQTMQGLCLRWPLVCKYFVPLDEQCNDKKAVYETQRAGAPRPIRMAFTIEEAQKAGLLQKDNWKNYPAAMLRARACAALARAVYPDLVQGIYTPDEGDELDRDVRSMPNGVATEIQESGAESVAAEAAKRAAKAAIKAKADEVRSKGAPVIEASASAVPSLATDQPAAPAQAAPAAVPDAAKAKAQQQKAKAESKPATPAGDPPPPEDVKLRTEAAPAVAPEDDDSWMHQK